MRKNTAFPKVIFAIVFMHKQIYAVFSGRNRTIIKPNEKCFWVSKILNTLGYP